MFCDEKRGEVQAEDEKWGRGLFNAEARKKSKAVLSKVLG
jgi:hypothetical protein